MDEELVPAPVGIHRDASRRTTQPGYLLGEVAKASPLLARAQRRLQTDPPPNDLAVILTRALSEQKPVTLRRAESRALERLLESPT